MSPSAGAKRTETWLVRATLEYWNPLRPEKGPSPCHWSRRVVFSDRSVAEFTSPQAGTALPFSRTEAWGVKLAYPTSRKAVKTLMFASSSGEAQEGAQRVAVYWVPWTPKADTEIAPELSFVWLRTAAEPTIPWSVYVYGPMRYWLPVPFPSTTRSPPQAQVPPTAGWMATGVWPADRGRKRLRDNPAAMARTRTVR
jgi:hypothetical protein